MLEKWSDVIYFGKHEGKTVKEVFKTEPSYLEWLIDNTEKTNFSQKKVNKIEKASNKERYNYLIDNFDVPFGDIY